MKKGLFILIIVAFSSYNVFAQLIDKGFRKTIKNFYVNEKILDFTWQTPEIDISQNHNEDSKDCKLAIDDNNTLYLVYNDDKQVNDAIQKIWFTKKTEGGTWEAPIVLDGDWPTTPYNEIGANATMPNIAVAPNGDIYVIWLMWDFPGRILTYTKYDASADAWNVIDTISQAQGSLDSWYFPQIYCTDSSNPVIFWGQDDRTGTNECYMKYNDGTSWSDDILISENDSFDAAEPKITKLPGNKSIVIFREGVDADTIAVKYRIYDEITHTLSPIKRVPGAEYLSNTYYHNFKIALKNQQTALMGMWVYESGTNPVVNKFIVWNYDISNDEFVKSTNELIFSESSSINQKYFDIKFNQNEECAFVYSNSYDHYIYYTEYDETNGFSTPVRISTQPAVAAGEVPSIAFDSNNNLHICFADDRYDTNNDGYLDRDIFYLEGAENTTFSEKLITQNNFNIFPNPVKNKIHIITNKAQGNKIIIYNSLGDDVKEVFSTENETDINIEDLKPGMYFIKIGNEIQKIIKL